MKKQFVKDLKDGEAVEDYFAVKFRKPPVVYKGDRQGAWFELRVGDKTGEITVKYWGDDTISTTNLYNSIAKGSIVFIKGYISEYPRGNGTLQISIDKETGNLRNATEKECDITDFVPVTPKNVNELIRELMFFVESTENESIRELLRSFFDNDEFLKKFVEAPAAMHYHQNYVGGLLEHTINMLHMAEALCKIHTKLDRSLLIAGAILHDIGKIWEFEVSTSIDVSRQGMLLGHIDIGIKTVEEQIEKMPGFPENLKLKILHIILSHHGKKEYGSPKEPQFAEAIAIHFLDEIDAKVDLFIRLKEEARTEDPWIWTKEFGHLYLE